MVVRKSSVGKGGFRGGPGGPGPPFCRYLIFQHYMSNKFVQYGIQAFANSHMHG